MAGDGGVGEGRGAAVTDGAGPGRRGRSAGPPPHGGCPYQYAANGARFPRPNDVGC